MKKIKNWRELRKGGIYNRVYTGNNKVYGRVDGKQTFIVLKTEPSLKVQTLFDQFGDVYSAELRSATITFTYPDLAFREFNLYEPENKSEWFIKSLKLTSLAEALDAKFIGVDAIKRVGKNSKIFAESFGERREMLSVHCNFRIEGTLENPLLQNVLVIWKNWEELRADFAKYEVEVQISPSMERNSGIKEMWCNIDSSILKMILWKAILI